MNARSLSSARATRAWLEAYAPERSRVAVRDVLPDGVAALDGEQRAFLRALAGSTSATPPSGGDAWQNAIFEAATAAGLPPARAFAAIYESFLGRTNGPRAGWLLASLDRAFVARRLDEAAGAATVGGAS
jgi:lysyl-tRNA synthetase class 1